MTDSLRSIAEARDLVLAEIRPLPAEPVATHEGLGRVLHENVVALDPLPRFPSSAMDGFALRPGPARVVDVVGESRAGEPFSGVLEDGQAVRISTGAIVPDAGDAVVPIERVEYDDTSGRVKVPETDAGAFVRLPGEDVKAGAVVLRKGTQLGPAELGLVAALGNERIQCARRPRVAVAGTGDELVPLGAPLGPGQIYDANAVALTALATRAGARVSSASVLPDSHDATVGGLELLAVEAEVLCISGGVSVGPHDHVRPALDELGFTQCIWGVRLKPGKPFYFGVRDSGNGRQFAFGLPGNPASTMVTFQLFVRPALLALQGADPDPIRSIAVMDAHVKSHEARDQAIRCRLELRADGWHVTPTGNQESHVITSMVGASALAMIPRGTKDVRPGDRVAIELI